MTIITGLSRRGFLRVGLGVGGRRPAGGLCAGRAGARSRPSHASTGRCQPTTAPAAAAKPPSAGQARRRCEAAPRQPPPPRRPLPPSQPRPPSRPLPPGKPEAKLGAHLDRQARGRRHQPDAKRPAKLGEAPMLAELVKAGKLPPVEQRVPEEPLVVKPLQRDRQVRRHLAARLHRPWRRRERQPDHGDRQADLRGLHRHQARAGRGQELGAHATAARRSRFSLRKGQKWSDGAAVHRRRLDVLVRGHLPEQGLTVPVRTAEMSINGKPGHDGEGRRH